MLDRHERPARPESNVDEVESQIPGTEAPHDSPETGSSRITYERRERALNRRVNACALEKLDTAIDDLRAEINNGGGYTHEKEEQPRRMALLTDAIEFVENRTEEQTIDQWEKAQIEHTKEMLAKEVINPDESAQWQEAIALASGILKEVQEIELNRLPDSWRQRTEFLQPERPQDEPHRMDVDELNTDGQLIACQSIIREIIDTDELIKSEADDKKKAELRKHKEQLGLIKRTILQFKPESGETLDNWFDSLQNHINEARVFANSKSDTEGLKYQDRRFDALMNARKRLREGFLKAFTEDDARFKASAKIYGEKLRHYLYQDYVTLNMGNNLAPIITSSREPTTEELAELDEWHHWAA